MIQKIQPIPTTEDSHPYAAAAKKCGFAEKGYAEDEFFMYGTANVYSKASGKVEVICPDAPYCNRFLVRRPSNVEVFSGRVIIEILNSTINMDIDRMWVISKDLFMREGDIFIGLSSKPNTAYVMKKYDPKRYAEISWANPREKQTETTDILKATEPGTEIGLFWDMLIDLAENLRDKERSPLPGYDIQKLYLTGWSQSGGYMIRFINDFAYKDTHNIPLFDGYLAGGSASFAIPPINQSEPANTGSENKDVPWILGKHTEPYIDVHTESENYALGISEARQDDSDVLDFPYREYDIPGSSHDTKNNMIEYYRLDPDLPDTGIFPQYLGREPYANDYPYEFMFNAAYKMLFDWAEKNILPPHIELIQVDSQGNNVIDDFGNAKGGWRSAFIDHPTARYHKFSTPLTPAGEFGCSIFGHIDIFGKEKVDMLYGSLKHYMELVAEQADKEVKAGLLLQEDYADYLAAAEKFAKRTGLE